MSAKRPRIGELRESVKAAVRTLAREGSARDSTAQRRKIASSSLDAILEDCLGWCDNYVPGPATWKRMRDAICALVDIADREDVAHAARQSARDLARLRSA